MKELSTEEKAKRYDEVIKVAKSNYETIVQMDNDCTFAKEGIVNTFHHMFPELKEIEDERMRKELIRAFKSLNTIKIWNGIERVDILEWLEKQGEQKPAWSEEDEMNLRRLMLYLSCREKIIPEVKSKYTDWFKSLKDRHTWNPSDEQMEALKGVVQEGVFRFGILESLYQDLKKLKGE